MTLVLEERYEPRLFIDTKNIPAALHLTSQRRFIDVRVTKIGFDRFLLKIC